MTSETYGWSLRDLLQACEASRVDFYCGVPDSSLAGLGPLVDARPDCQHQIAANEGQAVAWAIGYYLATGRLPLVYLQNSGLGHAMNPLVSLADRLVLGIPMILLVGWRGHPDHPDEPQHRRQGRITEVLLNEMGCQPQRLLASRDGMRRQVAETASAARNQQQPTALLLTPGLCGPGSMETAAAASLPSREQAIGLIAANLPPGAVIVVTTGKASRELFELRGRAGEAHDQDLLVVGGMGHAVSIASAIAQQHPARPICCLDGDGAVLMHLGALATTGLQAPANLFHFVLNNGAHESVGGQPTVGWDIDLPAVALACRYRHAFSCRQVTELVAVLGDLPQLEGPVLIEIRVGGRSRGDLSRPSLGPAANKRALMRYLHNEAR